MTRRDEVVVVGDLMVDVVAVPDGPLARGSDTAAVVRTTGGGSAANTAAWLAALGVPVALVSAVGDDPLGAAALAELEEVGVRWAGARVPGRPTGTCVVLVEPDGERTMLPDRGANDSLPVTAVEAAVPAAGWIHLSAYALLGHGSRTAARAAVAAARRARTPLSLDAASAAPLRAMGADMVLDGLDPTALVLANDQELAALGGVEAVLWSAGEVVTKHGAGGASWTDGQAHAHVAAVPATVVDSIGAGDAFDAGFIDARRRGLAPADALERAAAVAARAVARAGARPPALPPC